MTELLCILLKPALLWSSNPIKYFYLFPLALLAWLIDILLCHTFWVFLAGWPKEGEVTISHTLERLVKDISHPDNELFIQIALKINRLDPLHNHIKAVADL